MYCKMFIIYLNSMRLTFRPIGLCQNLWSHAGDPKTIILKGTSLRVEQSFGVQIICICCILFELCVTEEKEKRKNKIQIFITIFSNVKRINGTLGVRYTLQQLRVFIYKIFASLCCGYLGVAPIPHVPDVILKRPNPYAKLSSTVLLD